jgi:pimeloyl-ACP methyl ester carboxylesterase
MKLNANLERVEGNWPKGPVILMTHGTLAHGGMEIMSGLQGMFKDRGLSSLAINLSLGLDDRRGMYDCAVPHTHRHTDALDEIGAWLAWLKGQGAEKVALLGHSRGGNQTARFAASHDDPAVTAVILVAPQTWSAQDEVKNYRKSYDKDLEAELAKAQARVAAGRGGEIMEHVDFVYCKDTKVSAETFVSYYAPDEDLDTPHVIPRIKAPVVVFAGTDDQAVKGLVDKTTPLVEDDKVSLVVVDGADHFFRDLYSEDVADAVAEMLGE